MPPTENEMTQQEIKEKVAAGRARADERRAAIQQKKAEAKKITRQLKLQGWKLDYDLVPGRIFSAAYKWLDDGSVVMHFAIKSDKDQFSRPDARAALKRHVDEGTHLIQFSEPKPADGAAARKRLSALAGLYVGKRMLTHPTEFPAKMVKKFRSTLVAELRMMDAILYYQEAKEQLDDALDK